MNKYTRLFLDESRGHLAAMAAVLARHREGATAGGDLREGQRLAHSIKGMALYEQQHAVAALASSMERAFERLSGAGHCAGLLAGLEAGMLTLAALLEEVESFGAPETDHGHVVAALEACLGGGEG